MFMFHKSEADDIISLGERIKHFLTNSQKQCIQNYTQHLRIVEKN